MPAVHDLRPADTSEAYTISQTRDGIADGDVLICNHPCPDGLLTVYAVMVKAWPTSLDFYGTELMEDESFQLHWFADIRDIYTTDGGKYVRSLDAAIKHAETGSSREGTAKPLAPCTPKEKPQTYSPPVVL
jgi:hypothetical protein